MAAYPNEGLIQVLCCSAGSVETDTNFLTFPVAYKLESLCDRLWPTGPDDEHPLAGQYHSCSYGPGQVAFGVSVPLQHQYNMGSLRTQIRISDSSTPALTISCINVTVSPYQKHTWYWNLFLWLPAALLISYFVLACIARIVASVTLRNLTFKQKARPGGEPNFWQDRLIPTATDALSGAPVLQSPALLRFVTPGLADVLLYIQFVSVLGMISVHWPEFAYPYLSQASWASLLGNATLVQPSQADHFNVLSSNAFLPAGASGTPNFASQITRNASSPLYLDTDSPNTFLNLNGSRGGMESYAHMLGLRAVDVFGTTTAIWLIMVGAVTLLSLGAWIFDRVYVRRLHRKEHEGGFAFEVSDQQDEKEEGYPHHQSLNSRLQQTFGSHTPAYMGNLLRLLLLFHLPLTITSVYHFSRFNSSHPGTTACAALSFAFFCVIAPGVALWRLCTHDRTALWSDKPLLLTYGPLYNYFDHHARLFPIITFVHSLALGIVVGAGQDSGSAQAIIALCLEVGLALTYIIWLPWGDGASMAPLCFAVSVARVATSVLVLLLSSIVGLSPAARGWITYVLLLIQAIIAAIFTLLFLIKILEAIVRIIWRVSFDDSKSVRMTGLGGALRRIRRRKYKLHKPSQPGRKRGALTAPAVPNRSLSPSAHLMMSGKSTTPNDYVSTPYEAYFASDTTDEGIMSALPPLRGGSAYAGAQSHDQAHPPPVPAPSHEPGGFVRLGGGRATDDGDVPYDLAMFHGRSGLEKQTRRRGPPKKRFQRGLWWRRVPADVDQESLSSTDDEGEDEEGALETFHEWDPSRRDPPSTSQARRWGLFKRSRAKADGSQPSTPEPEGTASLEMGSPDGVAGPAQVTKPTFSVVRPPRGAPAPTGTQEQSDLNGLFGSARVHPSAPLDGEPASVPPAPSMELGPSSASAKTPSMVPIGTGSATAVVDSADVPATADPTTKLAGNTSAETTAGARKAKRSSSIATRATVDSGSLDLESPRSALLRAQIRTPQQLFALSESTHASEPMSESMFWLPSNSPEAQAALTPAPKIRQAPHMPVPGERERRSRYSPIPTSPRNTAGQLGFSGGAPRNSTGGSNEISSRASPGSAGGLIPRTSSQLAHGQDASKPHSAAEMYAMDDGSIAHAPAFGTEHAADHDIGHDTHPRPGTRSASDGTSAPRAEGAIGYTSTSDLASAPAPVSLPAPARSSYTLPAGLSPVAVEGLASPRSPHPLGTSVPNPSLLSVNASMRSRRIVEGQSAEILSPEDGLP